MITMTLLWNEICSRWQVRIQENYDLEGHNISNKFCSKHHCSWQLARCECLHSAVLATTVHEYQSSHFTSWMYRNIELLVHIHSKAKWLKFRKFLWTSSMFMTGNYCRISCTCTSISSFPLDTIFHNHEENW